MIKLQLRAGWFGPAIACLIAFATMASAQGTGQGGAQGLPMILPVDPAPLVAETTTGARSFTIEIADEAGERERGLMFRETMADDHGMLFVFDQARPVSFWMRNTPMPLDLIFVSTAGRVEAILPGEPFSEAVISPGEPVRFVFEVKRGVAVDLGIEPGDLLRHPAIEKADDAG